MKLKNQTLTLGFMVLILLIVLTGCTTVNVAYDNSFSLVNKREGDLTIVLSGAVPGLSVIVDNKLILDRRGVDTRKVIVEGIPEGNHEVKVFADSWQLKEPLVSEEVQYIGKDSDALMMVTVPPYSAMYWVYRITMAVLTFAPSIVVITY